MKCKQFCVRSTIQILEFQDRTPTALGAVMRKKYDRVYQFRITLQGIRPPIWRRIQVPKNYTFWDLHVAIQDAMGWLDYHLHEFRMVYPSTGLRVNIGFPDEDFGTEVLPGWEEKIAEYFSVENRPADYIYDFGDGWKHNMRLEKTLPREADRAYPTCVKGKRACPPEDCGGIWGYQHFLEAIMNPAHEEHEEMLRWAGGKFDPEHFDVREVTFDDPDERYRIAFEWPEELIELASSDQPGETTGGGGHARVGISSADGQSVRGQKAKSREWDDFAIPARSFYANERDKTKENWFLYELSNAVYDELFYSASIAMKYSEEERLQVAVKL